MYLELADGLIVISISSEKRNNGNQFYLIPDNEITTPILSQAKRSLTELSLSEIPIDPTINQVFSLEDFKIIWWEKIQADRDRMANYEQQPVIVNGIKWDANVQTIQLLESQIQSADAGRQLRFPMPWVDKEGVVQLIRDLAALKEIYVAIGNSVDPKISNFYYQAKLMEEGINSATSHVELLSIGF